jgi:hypothetical protein
LDEHDSTDEVRQAVQKLLDALGLALFHCVLRAKRALCHAPRSIPEGILTLEGHA